MVWSNGPGKMQYLVDPLALSDDQGVLPFGSPSLHGTPQQSVPPAASTSGSNPITGQNGGTVGHIADKASS